MRYTNSRLLYFTLLYYFIAYTFMFFFRYRTGPFGVIVMFVNFRFLTEEFCSKACKSQEKTSTRVRSTTSTVTVTSSTVSQTTITTGAGTTPAIATENRLSGTGITFFANKNTSFYVLCVCPWHQDDSLPPPRRGYVIRSVCLSVNLSVCAGLLQK